MMFLIYPHEQAEKYRGSDDSERFYFRHGNCGGGEISFDRKPTSVSVPTLGGGGPSWTGWKLMCRRCNDTAFIPIGVGGSTDLMHAFTMKESIDIAPAEGVPEGLEYGVQPVHYEHQEIEPSE